MHPPVNPDQYPDRAVLLRYVEGSTDAADTHRIDAWLASDAAAAREVEELRRVWKVAAHGRAAHDVDGAWCQFIEEAKRRMPAHAASSTGAVRLSSFSHASDRESAEMAGGATVKKLFKVWPQARLAPHSFRRAVGFGGVLGAVILAFGLSWWRAHTYAARVQGAALAAASTRDVRTRRGERATLDLTDGTRVVLAPESRLRVPADYATATGLGARDVELDGEAFFEVKHDANRPFRVRTATGIAEDLGTEFVVTAYPETRGMRVLVASGEVALRSAGAAPTGKTVAGTDRSRPLARLQAGDLAQVDLRGTVDVRHVDDARRRLAWTFGHLVFVKTPLPEALAALRRWYDVEFRVDDPALADRSVTVTFDRSSVQDIMESFAVLLDARAERHGHVVTFVASPR